MFDVGILFLHDRYVHVAYYCVN